MHFIKTTQILEASFLSLNEVGVSVAVHGFLPAKGQYRGDIIGVRGRHPRGRFRQVAAKIN